MTWKTQDVREEGREEVLEEVRGMVNMLKQKNVVPEQIIQMLCEQLSSRQKKPREE